VRAGTLIRDEAEVVARAYRFFWRLQCGARLLSERALDMEAIGEGGRAFLLRETGEAGLDALSARLAAEAGVVAAIIARHLGEDATADPAGTG